jgi:hypothetical protein
MTMKFHGKSRLGPQEDLFTGARKRKAVPYPFVLDALEGLSPETRPMFGCLAVYVGDQIVLILREKPGSPRDNGVWLATTKEHHESLRGEFPNMRSIRVLGKKVTSWQILAADMPDFEQAAQRACELILGKDPRIGKVPESRRKLASGVLKSKKAVKGKKAGRRAGKVTRGS